MEGIGKEGQVDNAIKQVDNIIERRGECIIGSVMEMFLGCDRKELADELRARGYVVRRSCQVKGGYVVYPKRKRANGPWMIIEGVSK